MHIIKKKRSMEQIRQKFVDLGREFQDLAKTCRQAARLMDEIQADDQEQVAKKVRRLQQLAQTVADAVAAKSGTISCSLTGDH